MLQHALFQRLESLSIITFISDVGPLLLISLSFSTLLFFCWYFGYALKKHNKKQKLWLLKNEGLIEEYKVLQLYLRDFGQQIPCCKKCNDNKMQLWNYQQKLLVVRCTACKMNYTFAKEHNKLILKVLSKINGVNKLLNALVFYQDYSLGKLLSRKLKIDSSTALNFETTPLEIIHFTTQNAKTKTPKTITDILILDWEVVEPKMSKLLAS